MRERLESTDAGRAEVRVRRETERWKREASPAAERAQDIDRARAFVARASIASRGKRSAVPKIFIDRSSVVMRGVPTSHARARLEVTAVLAMGFLSLSSLKSQVSKPYFPVVIFALATANTFAVFLSGLVTTLFVSTCVAVGKKRFAFVALCNALGATCGFALFVALLEARGVDWFRERYPEVFASKHWARGEEVVAEFGWLGVAGLSAMPFPLHPLVALGVLAGMKKRALLSALLLGRFTKYLVFGWVATTSPGALRRLGRGDEKRT